MNYENKRMLSVEMELAARNAIKRGDCPADVRAAAFNMALISLFDLAPSIEHAVAIACAGIASVCGERIDNPHPNEPESLN